MNPFGASSRPNQSQTGSYESSSTTQLGTASNTRNPSRHDTQSTEYVLSCVKNSGSKLRLVPADITTKLCDRDMFQCLRDCYTASRHPFWRWVTLRKLQKIEFVKVGTQNHADLTHARAPLTGQQFVMYHSNYVGMGKTDIGQLPPKEEIEKGEYLYKPYDPPDMIPIIPLQAMLHFFESPECAGSKTTQRLRMVKKLGQTPDLGPSLPYKTGWGLRFREKLCWAKVFVVMAVVAGVGVALAVAWYCTHSRDIQGASSLLACILAFGTIFLGFMHALSDYVEGSQCT
jgi:hypothetical protein